jgi:hypothetical protein
MARKKNRQKKEFPTLQIPEEMARLLDTCKITPEQSLLFQENQALHELGSIRRYLDAVESAFDREFQAFDARVAAQAAGMSEEAVATLVEDESLAAFDLTEHFPAFSWQTTFVAIYTLLEHELFELCRQLHHDLALPIGHNELKGHGIQIARTYLEKLCKLPIPAGDPTWLEVKCYNPIRNVIVHARGDIYKGKHHQEIKKYVAGKTSIRVDGNYVKITKVYCVEALDTIEALLRNMFRLALERLKEQKGVARP